MRTRRNKLGQAGDTIVEVLICIAIVSLILGGAFVTVNKSQLGVRDSQEHGNGLKLVESQLEQLRADAVAGGASADVFSKPPTFCMYNNAAVSTTSPATKADCLLGADGSLTTKQPQFQMTIGRSSPDASGGYLFTVQATWADVNGGNANEQMVYRLYK